MLNYTTLHRTNVAIGFNKIRRPNHLTSNYIENQHQWCKIFVFYILTYKNIPYILKLNILHLCTGSLYLCNISWYDTPLRIATNMVEGYKTYYVYNMIYDTFVNCNLVGTRWHTIKCLSASVGFISIPDTNFCFWDLQVADVLRAMLKAGYVLNISVQYYSPGN
jgi:hypothetical protein